MRSLIRYSGQSKRDLGMKNYDGLGYAPLKEDPSRGSMSAMQAGALPVSCNDSRTSALFVAETFGLTSAGFDMPYYMREMSILEKLQKEPGIKMHEVINRFTDWERDEIFPPLTPIIVELMLDEPVETGYVKVLEGTVYPQEGIAR